MIDPILRFPSRCVLLCALCWFLFPVAARSQPASSRPGADMTFIAIGDAGQPGAALTGNARQMWSHAQRLRSEGVPPSLLVFLGDNFYPIGLNYPEPKRSELIREVLGPHQELMTALGRANVHAIPGNHDYYCRAINGIPMQACTGGNEAEAALSSWTYHAYYPSIVRRAVAEGSRDSVDFIMFDSAVLLAVSREPIWRTVLDTLERLLRRSASSPGVAWRILCAHHSPYTVGEHGGWRLWNSARNRIEYIGNCISEGQDPFRYVYQFFSNQDNCHPDYRRYNDSLLTIIERSGAKIQAMMAGHDHSLQLLNYPDSTCSTCPKIFVVTGAGSKRATVKSPAPPREFTHPVNDEHEKGESVAGFTVCRFRENGTYLEMTFVDSERGEPLDMGGKSSVFRIDRSGTLVNQ